jgi:hypothetical protein
MGKPIVWLAVRYPSRKLSGQKCLLYGWRNTVRSQEAKGMTGLATDLVVGLSSGPTYLMMTHCQLAYRLGRCSHFVRRTTDPSDKRKGLAEYPSLYSREGRGQGGPRYYEHVFFGLLVPQQG